MINLFCNRYQDNSKSFVKVILLFELFFCSFTWISLGLREIEFKIEAPSCD